MNGFFLALWSLDIIYRKLHQNSCRSLEREFLISQMSSFPLF